MLRRMDRLTALLCMLTFTDTFGYAIVIPVFPFAAQGYGASTIAIGVILGSYSLCQLFTAPIIGALSDRLGRRPLLLGSQAGSAMGFLLMALARTVWPLALSRVIDGSTSGNISLVYAAVLDRYPRAEWGWRFSYLSSATGLGILLGLAVTTLLARFGLRAVSFVALMLCILSMAVTWAVFPETVDRQPITNPGQIWKAVATGPRSLHKAIVLKFSATGAQAGFVLAFPLFLARLLGFNTRDVSFAMLALVAVTAVFQAAFLPQIINRLKEIRAAYIGFALLTTGGLVTAFAGDLVPVLIGALLVLGGVSLLGPALTVLLASSSGLSEGAAMGLNQSVSSLGQMIGPTLGYGVLTIFSTAGFGLLCAAWAIGGAGTLLSGWSLYGRD